MRTKPRKPCTWDKIDVTFGVDYAALLFNVSRRTILNWCNLGEIPARKVGKFWVFDQEVIKTWVSEKEASQS